MSEVKLASGAAGRRAAIANGLHRAMCIAVEQRPGTEYPYLNIEYILHDTEDESAGATVFDRLSFAPNARWRTDEVLTDAYGIDVDEEFDTDDMIESEVWLYTVQERYEGVMTTNVQSTHPIGQKPELALPAANSQRSALIDRVNASLRKESTQTDALIEQELEEVAQASR